jgi:FkbM family methyltransferase
MFRRTIDGTAPMPDFHFGTITGTLAIMFVKGLRFGAVIDLGCADGNFYLEHFYNGLLPGSICVNVDANAMYEPSLRKIQETLGGHYVIAGICDYDGEIELQTGSHPYWGTLLPRDHPFMSEAHWGAAYTRPGKPIKVRALTLDTLVRDLRPTPPFLIKLDLQASELPALQCAEKALAETDAIIVEANPEEFPALIALLADRNFGLFDLTSIGRLKDGRVFEFYATFLNRRRNDAMNGSGLTEPPDRLIELMNERRSRILETNERLLAAIREKGPIVLLAS